MTLIVPTSTVLTDYNQITTLDGQAFNFRFMWNSRDMHWYFNLADADAVDIVTSVKVVCGFDLLRKVVDERRPAGFLMARNLTVRPLTDLVGGQRSLEEDPGIADLGGSVRLVYFEQGEFSA